MLASNLSWPLAALLTVGLSTGCAPTGPTRSIAPDDVLLETQSFKSSEVREVVEKHAGERTLYVFDIDNTLLQNPAGQFLGSAQWYDWQKDLPDGAREKVQCLLDMQGIAYNMTHMEGTEQGYASTLVAKLQSSGIDIIALTARGPDFRYPTERELMDNGMDFSKSMPNDFAGYPGSYLPARSPEISKPRNASYQNGVVMLAGQHKGAGLIDILDRIGAGQSYDTIVFFDDDEKNIKNMMASFTKDPRTAIVFHYQAVDRSFDQTQIAAAVQAQQLLENAYAQFKRRQSRNEPYCDLP